jgi:Transposase DDE domain
MKQYIQFREFTQDLFDNDELAEQAAVILEAILKARSPRLSAIARQMPGTAAATYKALQRFLARAEPQVALERLFQPAASYVIADPTELPRPGAQKTDYVGTLSDGKTRGFWLLLLATPWRGRAIPCGFVTYSSKTIGQEASSRNLEHWRAFEPLKAQLGERPLVLDREFSYLELLEYLIAAGIHFVIRLNQGSHSPIFLNLNGRKVELHLRVGEKVLYHNLFYRRQAQVNLIGVWRKGHARPLWVMTDLPPEKGLAIYCERMKIEETFRDLKSLLDLPKLMNKRRSYLEQTAAMVLLAYSLGVVIGEAIRDYLFPAPLTDAAPLPAPLTASQDPSPQPKYRHRYSGLFLVLKYKLTLSLRTLRLIAQQAVASFLTTLGPPVRTLV